MNPPLQHYDILKGLAFVACWVMIVFFLALVFGLRSQYHVMNVHDMLVSRGSSRDDRARVILAHAKRVIFSVLGYQGEERERQSLDQLHADWVFSNFGKIFVRFALFYFVYIWALILTTRAVSIDADGNVHLLTYTSKQIFGFLMIGVYIISNSLFDILSLYFTVQNLERISQTPTSVATIRYLVKNLVYSSGFFVLSQLISNLIWPLKTNIDVPLLDRLFSPAIALWPYVFVLDARSTPPEYLNLFFPGQLLITGTVFLPSLIVVLLVIVLSGSIKLARIPKDFMIARGWSLPRVEIRLEPGGISAFYFRCVNVIMSVIIPGVIAAAIWDSLKWLIFFSR